GITWETIGSVAARGAKMVTTDYNFEDTNPLEGNNYYRLKQLDKDGKVNYSNTIVLNAGKVQQISIASVYPNPVRNTVNVQIVSPAIETVSLIVTDITGKVLIQKNTALAAGDNTKQIDVSALSQGTYLIKAICANGCETTVFKFAKY
ncbi:MAG TPA: T9SS type A sorting domain-containing protein, partial [Chitinophagaceae bacterium]|nr:T9SS type A sorting domain-containing protein [Chitinophagaceae bacterium]